VAQIEAAAKHQEEVEAKSREAAEQGKPADGQAADHDAAEKAYYALEKQFRHISRLKKTLEDHRPCQNCAVACKWPSACLQASTYQASH
jgi:hypothetical protein